MMMMMMMMMMIKNSRVSNDWIYETMRVVKAKWIVVFSKHLHNVPLKKEQNLQEENCVRDRFWDDRSFCMQFWNHPWLKAAYITREFLSAIGFSASQGAQICSIRNTCLNISMQV
jgi:hypothetical protein